MADVSITGAGAHASAEATMRIPAITAAGVKGYLTPALIATYLEARTELAELIRDVIATALTAGSNITVTPDDGADTITIASSAAGVSDGDKGDVAVSGSGATWTVESYNGGTAFGALAALNTVGTTQIDNSAVTLAKMANLNQYELIGRTSAGAGAPEAIATSANVASLLQAANYAAIRGLLDLEPGTDFYSIAAADAAFQAKDTTLDTYAGIDPSANVQSLLGAADYAAMRGLLDLEAGTDFNAYDAGIEWLSGLNFTNEATFKAAVNLEAGTDFLPMSGGTLTGNLSVPDEAYGAGWNGSVEVPTKNAVYDKIETLGGSSVEDDAYGSGWNGDTTHAPSQNAVYDKFEGYARASTIATRWVVLSPQTGIWANGSAMSANTIYYTKFTLERSLTLSDLGARVTTAVGSRNFALAIYAHDNTTGGPTGTPLAATGNISGASTGAFSADITGANVTLTPGHYWAAVWSDSAVGLAGVNNSQITEMAVQIGSTNPYEVITHSACAGYSSAETYNASAWPNAASETLTITTGQRVYAVFGLAA